MAHDIARGLARALVGRPQRSTAERRGRLGSHSLERLEDRRLLAFDPSPQAQEMLEHVNRMRMNPQADTTTTMTAGGYQLQVPQGTYTVSATGSGLTGLYQVTGVQVVSANVKVDFNAQAAPVATAPSAPTGVVATTAKRRATVL